MLSAQLFNIRSRARGFPPFVVRRPPQAGQAAARHRQPASAGGSDGAR